MDSRNESMFLRISYTNPASLIQKLIIMIYLPLSYEQRSKRTDVFLRSSLGSIRRRGHVRHRRRHQVRRNQARL